MINRVKVSSLVLGAAVIFGTAVLFLSGDAGAQSQITAIPGVGFNASAPLADNLKALTGKDVYINLRSGKTYQGIVKSVGDHLIHLEKIAGKEFFDALIRTDDISAIEVKFRGYK